MLFAFSGGNLISSAVSSGIYGVSLGTDKMVAMQESAGFYQGRAYYPTPSEDFAPGVEERKITKTASLSTEVERGTFKNSETKLKNIISSSNSYLLNENVNKYEVKIKSYYTGYYQMKVEANKYDAVISQLKEIGEVKSFNEDSTDVTGSYTDAEIELQAEKERLARYMSMYEEAKDIADKIELNDRIFDQERRVKYLEDSIKNIGQRVDYSAIYFTMSEKQSEYANIAFVKFSELVRNLVGSFNALIGLLFTLVPWAVAMLILRFIWRIFKKKK